VRLKCNGLSEGNGARSVGIVTFNVGGERIFDKLDTAAVEA
jgi:hypothetical protein